jgi:hypothetical protein|tara:strand:- start:111 stop:560 length:450 start_codon:yes stop_codon:yes gene_type:complete
MDLAQYSLSDNDVEFRARKEKQGNLVSEISSEFTGNADQITITPASGKTFYLIGIKLYPVSGVAVIASSPAQTDVELTYDGTLKDVITYTANSYVYIQSRQTYANSQNAGQLTGNASGISMEGNGSRQIKLTSTNTTGTYRVSIMGYYE